MKHPLVALAFLLALATLSKTIGVGGETPQGIPVERFNSLTNGATLAEVQTRLGTNWQHQFTARTPHGDYVCVSYQFQHPFVYYYFLFRGGRLKRICIPPPFEVEIVERNGMRLEIRKPVDSERRVAAVLAADGISPEELVNDIGRRIQGKNDTENLGVIPALVIASPLLVPRTMFDTPAVRREYQRNQELRDRFDPLKIEPDALLVEARRAYGKELFLRRLKDGRIFICWGESEQLHRVKPEHRYSKVCAIVEGERIQQIYSHDFVQGIDPDLQFPE